MKRLFLVVLLLFAMVGNFGKLEAQTSENVINIRASTPTINLGSAARFTVSRSGNTSQSLTVGLWISAGPGVLVDDSPNTSITFRANERSRSLNFATHREAVLEPHLNEIHVGIDGRAGSLKFY